MTSLKLVLLGGFQVRASGQSIDIPGRKERALLALLAMTPGEGHSRDKLAALLWSDRGNKQARDSLKQAVLRLRKSFDPVHPLPVMADRDALVLDRASIVVDVAEFEQLIGEGTPEALGRATALYRGDLLDGLDVRDPAFEEWLIIERQRLRALACEVAGKLVDQYLASGARDRAGAAARRLLALDPLRESAHRALIKIYAEQGQATLALRQYQLCRDALQRELGVRPEAETERLYQSVRARRTSARRTPGQAPEFEVTGEQGPTNLDETVALPGQGRKRNRDAAIDRRPTRASENDLPSTLEAVLQRPAVAILPFVNLSVDAAQEYFADGITEDLITSLAHWRWFPVIARNSTFTYKGRAVDVMQVGRELNVRYVVEGSLRRAGERVRINAQLIDAGSGHHLWAQIYDRHLGDIFELQDELTRAIVVAIEPQITHAEQRRVARKRPGSLDAWDLSLQALAQIHRGSVPALTEAKRLLRSATSMDSTSSYAQSLLALAEFHSALAGWTRDPAGTLAETLSAAEAAVELDDNDWLAHTLLGIATLLVRRAYDKAVQEEELALALNPSASLAYHFLGCALTFAGQPAQAIPKFAAVLDIDPRFPLLTVTLADLGLAHLLVGDLAASLDLFERALAEQAGNVRAWQRKTVALAHMGRIEEAQTALARVFELQPSFSAGYVAATYPFYNTAHTAVIVDGLHKAGWRE
jgi:TolB-like protein/DNA-binding SARP family transcriptional activator/Flp pilus assembly protein TadD